MNNKLCPGEARGSEGHFRPIALGELFVGGDLGLGAEGVVLEILEIFAILRMLTVNMRQIVLNTK